MKTLRNLAVFNFARGVTFWTYKHEGKISETLEFGFFTDWAFGAHMLCHGDLIFISAQDGGALRFIAVNEQVKEVYLEKLV
jgi:hypothetical protein